MKRYMKYLAALLFLLSLVVLLFMPVIGISSIDLSMLDVLRAGGELGEGWGGFSQILKEYLQPYFFGIILIIILLICCGNGNGNNNGCGNDCGCGSGCSC